MPILKITQPTVLKTRPVQSYLLSGTERLSMAPQELAATEATLEGNHYRVVLQQPLKDRREWFAFQEHVTLVASTPAPGYPDQPAPGSPAPAPAATATLLVKAQTIFKARLALASELSSAEKINAKLGEFAVESIEDVGDSHLKIVLVDPIDDRKEWFVFRGHVSVVNVPPYPAPKDDGKPEPLPRLKVNVSTVFKIKPVASGDLGDSEKISISPGEFPIAAVRTEGKHHDVTFKQMIDNRLQWFVFSEHVTFLDADGLLSAASAPAPAPAPTPAPEPRGPMITIAGYGSVGLNDPIIPNGNFTWAEATKGGSRLPESATISRNIIRMAERMEEVRNRLGNRSIHITSWYRPPAVNRAVGGATFSTHIQGHGVDFVASGLSPRAVQQILDPWWPGGLGYGSTFTHLDNRGYRARWNYGN
ncbi:MAG: D-Ala-D-Ala carboxypeptidase family metallohydrolase [Cyanobacteria bacterium]|nr:D-Ala-D-Ala carboxypeptidase family metallohydrolase [Cyanobacteriota bacterium]